MDKKEMAKWDSDKSIAWLRSEEGQRKLQESRVEAEKHCEKMRNACYVDWRVLLEPTTI